jgi:hypothetical protein
LLASKDAETFETYIPQDESNQLSKGDSVNPPVRFTSRILCCNRSYKEDGDMKKIYGKERSDDHPGDVKIKMHHSILSPILPALMEEAYRVAATLWLVPWVKDIMQGWIQLVAVVNDW